ncbi:TPA: hypothetical protein JS277_004861 [Escherichia coli]|nr:hypothetical protein [Escherichia coli]EFO6313356.1 hypothetical protein [Escherichia coli]EFU2612741.1 hypothetical protein [Escherichia coli]HAY0199917.1 hypothetical protein [Escherichia coli]
MGSCAAPSVKGDDKFITTDYLQQCRETRQDYKDTRRFPLEAPSCALLFRPCRLPDTCPPFSLREAWRFLIAHAVGISVRCRSFAPGWAVCTTPPFSPTAAPYPVTIVLSPTR